MCQSQLKACHTVCKKVTEHGSEEYTHSFVDFKLHAELIDSKGKEWACNCHRECVGAQSSKSAVGQQDRLEKKHDNTEDGYR